MPSKSYLSPLCSCIVCRTISSSNGIHTHFYRSHTNKTFSSGNNGSYHLQAERAKEKATIDEIAYLKEPKNVYYAIIIYPSKVKIISSVLDHVLLYSTITKEHQNKLHRVKEHLAFVECHFARFVTNLYKNQSIKLVLKNVSKYNKVEMLPKIKIVEGREIHIKLIIPIHSAIM